MQNSVRTLQSSVDRIQAKGRWTIVRVDPDTKYQGGELIVIGTSDIERPPILTGVVVSTGSGRWAKYTDGVLNYAAGGSVWQSTPYAPGQRVTFCRGEGYHSWHEQGDDGEQVEYRVLETFDQLLGYVLEGDATNMRQKLTCQHGVMD